MLACMFELHLPTEANYSLKYLTGYTAIYNLSFTFGSGPNLFIFTFDNSCWYLIQMRTQIIDQSSDITFFCQVLRDLNVISMMSIL